MSILNSLRVKLGLSNTAPNNFTLTAEADDGTMKLARGNPGATTQDILKVDAAGNVLASSGVLGYGTGGTVTQDTSKATAVTLNKPAGRITLSSGSLAAGAIVAFTFNNSCIKPNDVPVVALVGQGTNYNVWVGWVTTGACSINVQNISAGALNEVFSINFAIIRGATA